jgi:hypothetical protein
MFAMSSVGRQVVSLRALCYTSGHVRHVNVNVLVMVMVDIDVFLNDTLRLNMLMALISGRSTGDFTYATIAIRTVAAVCVAN